MTTFRELLLEKNNLPCLGLWDLYDAATSSPIAARAASIICNKCSLKEKCAEYGAEERLTGVFGGRMNGVNEIKPLTKNGVNRWLRRVQRNEEIGILDLLWRGYPTLKEILKEFTVVEDAETGCLIVDKDPITVINLRRQILMEGALLTSETADDKRQIKMTCNDFRCISIFHMTLDSYKKTCNPDKNRIPGNEIAYALFLLFRKGYTPVATANFSGISRTVLFALNKVISTIGFDTQIFVGSISDTRDWIMKVGLSLNQLTEVLLLARTASECSCTTVNQIIDSAGRAE